MATGGTKVVVQAISGNFFITIIKFIGWFVSHSPSLLAEAIHSAADTSNQILLLIGMKQSQKQASRDYPRGHGSSSYMWNLISAVGVFFIGFGVTFYHGIHSLLSGHYESGTISWIAITVLVVAFIIEFYVLIGAYKEVKSQKKDLSYLEFFHESDDPTVLAVLLEDGVAVLGVLLALTGILLGQVFQTALFDIGASIAISLLLGFMAIALAFINGKLLIGRSLSLEKEDQIKSFVFNLPEVESIEKIQTIVLGASRVRLSLEIELCGESIIDKNALNADAKKLASGDEPIKVLTKTSTRMVRATGKTINEIEALIYNEFPEVKMIDFEIN